MFKVSFTNLQAVTQPRSKTLHNFISWTLWQIGPSINASWTWG